LFYYLFIYLLLQHASMLCAVLQQFCPSVRQTPVICQNEWTQDDAVFAVL